MLSVTGLEGCTERPARAAGDAASAAVQLIHALVRKLVKCTDRPRAPAPVCYSAMRAAMRRIAIATTAAGL